MRRTTGAIVCIVMLATPAVALALSRVLHGPAGSGGSGTVDLQFNIKKKHATRITRFEFSNIPATCRGFPPTAVSDTFAHKIAVATDGRFHATEKTNGGRVTYTVSGRFLTLHKAAGMLLQGRREDGLPLLLKGFDAFRATGAELRVPSYLGMLGDAYTRSASFEDAHKALDEGLAVAEKNDDRCHEAELHRLKGELLLAESADQSAAAEDCFRRAAATARRQQSRGWELRAAMSLARLWQRQGRRGEAHERLAAVQATYTEGWTTPDLMEAGALLEALG